MRPWWQPLSAAAGSAILAVHAWPTRWTTVDDAWISARYAAQLAAGNGLVYNAGEAVEGFSNPLWTIGLGLWLAAGGDAATGMVWGGLLHALLLPPACLLLARVLAGERAHPVLAVAPLGAAASPHVAVIATNGLETAQWLLAVVLALAAAIGARGQQRAWAGLLLGGLAWVRPEGLGVAAAIVSIDLASRRSAWRSPETWALALGAAAPVALLLAWRLWTYGEWLPNTWAAKKGHLSFAQQWPRNWRYLNDDGWTWPLVGLALLGAALSPPLRAGRLAVGATALLIAAAALRVELWMPGARLVVVGWVLAASAVAAASADGEGPWRRAVAPAALLAALGLQLTGVPAFVRAYDSHHSVLPDNPAAVAAHHVAAVLPAGATVGVRDAGVFAFHVGTDARVAERHPDGLTVPHPGGARVQLSTVLDEPPEVLVTTVQREDAPRSRYALDQRALKSGRYRFLGRVEQHYHRYYDVWVREDVELAALPAELVVPVPGPPR